MNDESNSYQITNHLIGHGYKKIAYLGGAENLLVAQERFLGFKRALTEYHIPLKKRWVQESGFRESGGYKAMNKLLSLPKDEWPRAVVAINDPAAFGAMKAIQEHGLSIPDDIAITGFSDDIRAALITPANHGAPISF